MNKELKKHPILKFLNYSDYDEIIREVHQSIHKWPICWIASEQLEYKFNGNKILDTLWFQTGKNSIEFFNTNSNELLARIEFDSQLLKLPASSSEVTLGTSL